MTEPIISIEHIQRHAQTAADSLAAGRCVINPYPPGSAAAAAWDREVLVRRMAVEGDAA